MTTEDGALRNYHNCYDNDSYRAVQIAIAVELYGERVAQNEEILALALSSEPMHYILNLTTDVALEMSGHPGMTGKIDKLAAAVAREGLSRDGDVVNALKRHFGNFDLVRSEEFAIKAEILMELRDFDTGGLASLSASLSGRSGLTVNYLLHSIDFIATLVQLEAGGEPSAEYKKEKLGRAETFMSDAKKLYDDGD